MECGERARGIAVGPPTPECLTPVFRWWLRMGRNISLYVLLSVLHNLCDVDEVRRTDVFSDKVHFGAEGDVDARRLLHRARTLRVPHPKYCAGVWLSAHFDLGRGIPTHLNCVQSS